MMEKVKLAGPKKLFKILCFVQIQETFKEEFIRLPDDSEHASSRSGSLALSYFLLNVCSILELRHFETRENQLWPS